MMQEAIVDLTSSSVHKMPNSALMEVQWDVIRIIIATSSIARELAIPMPHILAPRGCDATLLVRDVMVVSSIIVNLLGSELLADLIPPAPYRERFPRR
jgi:hypothetical protein